MNVEKIYLLQDEILQTLGKLDIPFVFSGSTPLTRAYYNHRYSFDLQFFSEKGNVDKKILEKIKSELDNNFFILEEKEQQKLKFPKPVESFKIKVAYKEDEKGENAVSVEFFQDLFNGIFGTIKLELGIKLEELDGIYFRKLIDFFNEPLDTGNVVDIIVMDEEYPLEDFYPEFMEILNKKGFKIEQNDLYKKLKKFQQKLEKDIIEVDKELKFLGSVIDVHHVKKWINNKLK